MFKERKDKVHFKIAIHLTSLPLMQTNYRCRASSSILVSSIVTWTLPYIAFHEIINIIHIIYTESSPPCTVQLSYIIHYTREQKKVGFI